MLFPQLEFGDEPTERIRCPVHGFIRYSKKERQIIDHWVFQLAYFAQAVGVPVPCSFEIYNYGPYSDAITFNVESMIADDIVEDKSTNSKYSNYRLASATPKFSVDIQTQVSPHTLQIEKVVQTLGGFDPSTLEILATLHFINARIRSLRGNVTKEAVMKQFFEIKAEKFSWEDVSSWYDALESAQLV